MPFAIPFPDISPEIFTIEFGNFAFALRWYALAYILGFVIAWRMVVALMRRPALWPRKIAPMEPAAVEGLLTWVILGVILGGRLGFVLFYQPAYFLQNPLQILAVWQGGMAFHGGLIGAAVAGYLFCRRNGIVPIHIADAMAMAVPPGLFLGRIANFINAELWGRPTEMPWGVIFPGPFAQACPWGWQGPCARHPTQLYEAGLEGLVLGAVLLWLVWRRGTLKLPGLTLGVFFAGYGLARFTVEFWRMADPQFVSPSNPMGFVVRLGEAGLSMGQLLSLPMVLVGAGFIWWSRSRVTAQT